MPPEYIPGHKFGGQHVLFNGADGKIRAPSCLSQLIEETILHIRVHLKGMSQSHLFFPQPG